MSRILTLIFILSASTCTLTFGQQNPDEVITDRYRTKNFDCVIFPANYLTLIGGTRFTPTREQVDMAEQVMRERLKEINQPLINQGDKHNPIIHKKLKKYRRQYFGFTDEQGNKILLMNCFWNQKGRFEYWENERVMVLDGGSNYWSIQFNLETEELFELGINGNG
jgi:hypothetical protein